MNFDPYLAKWILNVKLKTIKLNRRNIGENLCKLGVGKDFLNTKSMICERKNGQIGLHQNKTFLLFKDTVKLVPLILFTRKFWFGEPFLWPLYSPISFPSNVPSSKHS